MDKRRFIYSGFLFLAVTGINPKTDLLMPPQNMVQIEGSVKHEDGTPIAGASIYIKKEDDLNDPSVLTLRITKDPSILATTDSDGKFSFEYNGTHSNEIILGVGVSDTLIIMDKVNEAFSEMTKMDLKQERGVRIKNVCYIKNKSINLSKSKITIDFQCLPTATLYLEHSPESSPTRPGYLLHLPGISGSEDLIWIDFDKYEIVETDKKTRAARLTVPANINFKIVGVLQGHSDIIKTIKQLKPGSKEYAKFEFKKGTAPVSGVVIDQDGNPLKNIIIGMTQKGMSYACIKSDNNGRFIFNALPGKKIESMIFLKGDEDCTKMTNIPADTQIRMTLHISGDAEKNALKNQGKLSPDQIDDYVRHFFFRSGEFYKKLRSYYLKQLAQN
ncbi:MAG: carboxypeptidase regulatory-like domain-containing protein [Planctomycetes bacterium]|nr:carboxypeptidase regulatory-like domain-containing protein [Planctomycetota bacterium]